MNPTIITIEAEINADAAKTWNYYTQPQHIIHWNFASDDWQCPSAENDLQVGGKYKARMEAKDGSFGFDFEATYSEVIDNKKLVYAIADGRKVIVSFEENGNKTNVITEFEAEGINPAEMQKQGWQAILNNFKKYTEAN